jgi:hypothetical protein
MRKPIEENRLIVFVTSPGHGYTVAALKEKRYGVATPTVQTVHYYRLFLTPSIPVATYIFADLERLAPWELALAASLYRSLVGAGLRCLNDPARAHQRYPLLRALHAAGINPFTVYRADDNPRPRRFPVFLRDELNHNGALAGLVLDQADLDARLAALRRGGTPLTGLLVVEYCAEPIAPSVWRKWGSYRIADGFHADHGDVEDTWSVKYGMPELETDAVLEEEHAFVAGNAVPDAVRRAFAIGDIEFGRADHAVVDGATVIYEINTNPVFLPLTAQGSATRDDSKLIGRRRMADLLAAIDTQAGGMAEPEPEEQLRELRGRTERDGPILRP